jgi:hypothetical protein
MWRTVIVLILALALPGSASAGPLKEAAEKAGRDLARKQQEQDAPGRGRFWTGIGLLAGGGTLALLGGLEFGDDESGPDDGEDSDNSDDGEDSDGWGNKAMIGGGIAAAALGGVLLFTGKKEGPAVSVTRGRVAVRHTVRF